MPPADVSTRSRYPRLMDVPMALAGVDGPRAAQPAARSRLRRIPAHRVRMVSSAGSGGFPGPSSTGRSAAWSTPGSSRPSRSSRASAPSAPSIAVTPQGREEAERWLSTPVEHVRDIRSHLLIKLALLYRAGRDPADLLRRQRAALDPIARAIQAPRAEPDGFDEILLAWRRATAAAAAGLPGRDRCQDRGRALLALALLRSGRT